MPVTENGLRPFLEEIAREGGEVALAHFGRVAAEAKDESIVSEADRAVERLLVSRIRARFPGDYILGEESGGSGPAHPGGGTRWWAIDPIDGTGPYLSGLPFWAVAVACMRGPAVVVGAVFLPASGEMYSAEAGGRAERNGEPLSPMDPSPAGSHSYLFVPCREVDGLRIDYAGPRLTLSAAALHLIYAASGSAFGAVIEPNCVYDFAAASLVIERAGGLLRYASGAPVDFATLADGRRAPEPVVAAAADQVDWLCGQVSWTGA